MNEPVNNPFANMNMNQEQKPDKKSKIIIIALSAVIVVLLGIVLISITSKPKNSEENTAEKENLESVASELQEFITNNNLDALDAYSHNELLKVAIHSVCFGIHDCNHIDGGEVKKYIKDIFNKEIPLTNIQCDVDGGDLYVYDGASNTYNLNGEHANHENTNTTPTYTKLNSIKKNKDKYVMVLNKLYFDSSKSEYITADPLGIYNIYKFSDYDMPSENGPVLDSDKLIANYENNFSKLKNKGVRYQYVFSKNKKTYYLEKYKIIKEEDGR